MKARYFVVGALFAATLTATIVWAGSPFFVAYWAAEIAGDRLYCIMVSNHDDRSSKLYQTVTQRSQLSMPRLTAKLEHTWGSRGFYHATNYALLVLDEPREYLNWSFRSLNFKREAPINITHGTIKNKPVALMQFEPCTPQPNFSGSLQ